MIKAHELLNETNKNLVTDKVDRYLYISLPEIEEQLLERAKLGKTYLVIGQGNIRWMSVPEFREKLKQELERCGYVVKDMFSNIIHVSWE